MSLSNKIKSIVFQVLTEANVVDDIEFYNNARAIADRIISLRPDDLIMVDDGTYTPKPETYINKKDLRVLLHTDKNTDSNVGYSLSKNGDGTYELDLYSVNIDNIKSSVVKHGVIHELIHYFDGKRLKSDKINTKHVDFGSDYYNSPLETNAYYQQFFGEVVDKLRGYKPDVLKKTYPTYQDFFDVIAKVSPVYQKLNDENKKKVQKRLYNFYHEHIDLNAL